MASQAFQSCSISHVSADICHQFSFGHGVRWKYSVCIQIFFPLLSVTGQLFFIQLDAYRPPVMTTCPCCDCVSILPPRTLFFSSSPTFFINHHDVFVRTLYSSSEFIPSHWSALGWAAVAQGMACYGFDVSMFNALCSMFVKCNCKQVNSVMLG